MKFRKSPHWTEKSLRHAQKPATPRSTNPCGPESTSVTPGKDPPMATPPQGRKMAPERPFPILIETGKSDPKTGLFQAVFGGFSDSFASGLPAVFPAVSRPFCQWSPGRFASGLPAVLPVVCRRFSRRFASDAAPLGSTPIRLRRTPSSERNCRAIPYTLSSLQTQHSARQAPGWFGRAVAGKVGRR